jgi:hypothetical protein
MALENAERAACTQRFNFLQPCGNYGHQLMIYIMDLRPGSFSTFLSQYQESYSEELKKQLKDSLGHHLRARASVDQLTLSRQMLDLI